MISLSCSGEVAANILVFDLCLLSLHLQINLFKIEDKDKFNVLIVVTDTFDDSQYCAMFEYCLNVCL